MRGGDGKGDARARSMRFLTPFTLGSNDDKDSLKSTLQANKNMSAHIIFFLEILTIMDYVSNTAP